jgi:hypothetical protein
MASPTFLYVSPILSILGSLSFFKYSRTFALTIPSVLNAFFLDSHIARFFTSLGV